MKTAIRRTPEEALRASVDALGGLQEVGYSLKPDVEPSIAGQWLSHCLTASFRDKLSLGQIAKIFRDAHAIGSHDGFAVFAHLCGYTAIASVPQEALLEAQQRALASVHEAQEAARDLQDLIDNPRLLATMQAAGLKVEA